MSGRWRLQVDRRQPQERSSAIGGDRSKDERHQFLGRRLSDPLTHHIVSLEDIVEHKGYNHVEKEAVDGQ